MPSPNVLQTHLFAEAAVSLPQRRSTIISVFHGKKVPPTKYIVAAAAVIVLECMAANNACSAGCSCGLLRHLSSVWRRWSSPPSGGVWRRHNGAPNDRLHMILWQYEQHAGGGSGVLPAVEGTGLLLARPHGIKTNGNKEIWIWIGLAMAGLDGMGPCASATHMKSN